MSGDDDPKGHDVLKIDMDGAFTHLSFITGDHEVFHDGLKQTIMSAEDTCFSTLCLPKKTKNGVLSVIACYVSLDGCHGPCDCCGTSMPAKMSTRSFSKRQTAAVPLNTKLAGIVPGDAISPVVFCLRYTPVRVNLTDDHYTKSIEDYTHLKKMRSIPLRIPDFLHIAAESGIHLPAFKNGAVPDCHFWSSILNIWKATNMNARVMNAEVIGALSAADEMRPAIKEKLLAIEKMQEEAALTEFREIDKCSPEESTAALNQGNFEAGCNDTKPVEDLSTLEQFKLMCDIAAEESSPAVKAEMLKKIENVLKHMSTAVGENMSFDVSDDISKDMDSMQLHPEKKEQ